MNPKPCEVCGKLFKPYRSYQRWCCKKCARIGVRSHRSVSHHRHVENPYSRLKLYRWQCQKCGRVWIRTQKPDMCRYCGWPELRKVGVHVPEVYYE